MDTHNVEERRERGKEGQREERPVRANLGMGSGMILSRMHLHALRAEAPPSPLLLIGTGTGM